MKRFIVFVSTLVFCIGLAPHVNAIVIEAMRLQREDGKTVVLLGDMHMPFKDIIDKQGAALKRHLGAPQMDRVFFVENSADDQLDKEMLEKKAEFEKLFGAADFLSETGKILKRENHQVVNIECRSLPYIHFFAACTNLFLVSYTNTLIPAHQNPLHPETACALVESAFYALNAAIENVSFKPICTGYCPDLYRQLLEPTCLELAALRTYVDDFFHDIEHKNALECRTLVQRLAKIPANILDVNIIKHLLCAPEQQVYVVAGAVHTRAIAEQLEKQGFVKTHEWSNAVGKKIVEFCSKEALPTAAAAPDICMHGESLMRHLESITPEFERFLLFAPLTAGSSAK